MKLRAKTKNRLRHHTNPLTYREDQLFVPDWTNALGGVPKEVDIGIGLGDFLCAYAKLHPERRIAGLEVREAFCDEARLRIEQQNITKNQENSLEPPTGFEPATCSLRMNYSTN